MEPENTPTPEHATEPESNIAVTAEQVTADPGVPLSTPVEPAGVGWIFFDEQGLLRAGWSLAIFAPLMVLFSGIVGALLFYFHLVDQNNHIAASSSLFGELIPLLGLAGATSIVALLEQRRGNLLSYNLIGPHRTRHFFTGLGAGFVALSALIGGLKAGGWLALLPATAAAPELIKNAAMWSCAFLLVGCFEEGMFRCYLQATLTRGINLWWALGWEAVLCGILAVRSKGTEGWGVYAIALLGLAPCLWLHLQQAESAGFWQAAWVTSSFFGFVHTGNNGENWIGIFAAAGIGFVFCVSVRLTGSAWWAIGFHAAWDWTETFFYGTADSGMAAQGSYLTSKPTGNVLWSGGADGPEGSLLVIAVILLLLVALVAAYGRNRDALTRQSAV
jgi:membrane protease YdiL (CAAX protease family)